MAVSWLYYKPYFTVVPAVIENITASAHITYYAHITPSSVADPGSEKSGAPGVCPQDFLKILANLGYFFKYLPKIGGRPPPPWIRYWSYPTYFEVVY